MWLITISIVSGRFFAIKISLRGLHFTFQNAWPKALKKKAREVWFVSLPGMSLSQGCSFLPAALLCFVEIPWPRGWRVPAAHPSIAVPGTVHQQQTGTKEAQILLWCLCVCEESSGRAGLMESSSPSRGLLHKMPLLRNLFSPWLQPECLKPKGCFVLCERISLSHWWVPFALSMSVPHKKRFHLPPFAEFPTLTLWVCSAEPKQSQPATHLSLLSPCSPRTTHLTAAQQLENRYSIQTWLFWLQHCLRNFSGSLIFAWTKDKAGRTLWCWEIWLI